MISCFSSPPAWDLSAARKFFIIHFWKIGLIYIKQNTKLISRSKSYCCIPQAQLKLYLSKDITRQNTSIFHFNPGICVEIYCSVGRIKLNCIIHRFTSDFYGGFTGSRKLYQKSWHFFANIACNTTFPLLRFHSALHCGYSGITDIQDSASIFKEISFSKEILVSKRKI